MNSLIVLTVTALFCATVASGITCGSALAQSGSTGGTLGKADKSLSGDREDQTVRSVTAAPKPKGLSVGGRWLWSADCQSGHYGGGFELAQNAAGQVNGVLFSDASGGSISGQVNNGTLSFTRTWAVFTQHWIGQIGKSGRRLSGSLSGNENCTWTARRE